MMEFNDTVKMRECGQDIIRLSEDLRNTIDAMFDRISNMPANTKEWVGTSAEAFARISRADKTQYVELKDTMYKYGKYLIDSADHMEKMINKVRR